MISAMLTVLIAWIAVFCVIAGWGQVIRDRFGLRATDFDSWFDVFWIGYAIVIAILQLWHLALPIDWRTCVILAAIGVLGLVWNIRRREPSGLPVLRLLIFVVMSGPVAAWVVSRALAPQLDFDTGLYHLASIRWTNEYPAVPGLGNLHYRLAFNQSFFLFVAALNVYPYFGQGFHVANSLLLIVLAAQLLWITVRAIFRPHETTAYHALAALFLPIVLYRASHQAYSANISSPSPDLSVFLLQIVVTLALVRYIFAPQAEKERFNVFFIVAMSVVGTTMKLSFAAFGASAIAFIGVMWLWQNRQQIRCAGRHLLVSLVVMGGLIGLPWIANSIVESGYPFFPSTVGALPVDFRIPTAIVTDAADWVRTFARDPRGDEAVTLSNWDWLQGWRDRLQEPFSEFLFVYPLIAFAILVIADLILWITLFAFRQHPDPRLWLPFLPAIVSGLFWFISAPDPRFAGSAFWILALWGLTVLLILVCKILLVTKVIASPGPRTIGRIAALVPLGAALVLVYFGLRSDFNLDGPGFPRIPVTETQPYQTESGLLVNMAANPDFNLQLWDAPLPATPYEMPHLELRGNGLRSGFRMTEP